MKLFNNIVKVAVVALAGCSFFTACMSDKDFLEEKSYEFNDQTYFTSEATILYSLNACYNKVNYLMTGQSHGMHSWMLQGIGLDTFTGTGGGAEWAANWTSINNGNGTTRHWYDEVFQLVNRANLTISAIDNNPDIKYSTPTRKTELRAEAVLFRAWAYRCLTAMFGNVPIIDSRITEVKYDYLPNTRQESWEFMYEDLKWAEANLPSSPRLPGCVTKAAAGAYLAEVCLDLGKFDEAVEAASRVIDKKDGDYQIMTTRFGSRKDEKVDRYGNSLAAPMGAYWDLFREGGNQDYESGNKEAIWTLQYNYGTYSTGGAGDSWWRVQAQYTEAAFSSNLYIGKGNGTASDAKTGNLIYKYGDNVACFAPGVVGSSTKVEGTDPKSVVITAVGRYVANVQKDSLGSNNAYMGQNCLPTRYMWEKKPGFNLWEDETDFRGSETMIQRNWFTAAGTRWLDEKAKLYERQAAGVYTFTGADTMATFIPRFWKFSDDKHPNGDTKAFDQELYMLRMPEVYFLRAEAYLAKGDKAKAAADLNVVRSRAGARPCTAAQVNIDYILDERARELMGEEHRWVTLSRLSCNPNCTYISDCYPVQNDTESNTLYARTRKYGRGFENDETNNIAGRRQRRNDGYEAWYSNITPHNYLFPIPTQVIEANTDAEYPQNPGY